MAVAKEWYESDDYALYRNIRINEFTNFASIVFIEGMQPKTQNYSEQPNRVTLLSISLY